MFKFKNLFKLERKKLETILFYAILSGVLILSAGVGLIGLGIGSLGTLLIVVGSGLFYIGVVTFVFVIR